MRFRILWDLAGIMPVSSLKSSLPSTVKMCCSAELFQQRKE